MAATARSGRPGRVPAPTSPGPGRPPRAGRRGRGAPGPVAEGRVEPRRDQVVDAGGRRGGQVVAPAADPAAARLEAVRVPRIARPEAAAAEEAAHLLLAEAVQRGEPYART